MGYINICFVKIKKKESIESFFDEPDDFINSGSMNSLIRNAPTKEKTFAMIDIKESNNFDLSYY